MAADEREQKRVLAAEALRTTRFSDVCGGTDELKRLLTEEPDWAATPEGRAALGALVDDGLYMLARMEERLREYQAFRDLLAGLVERMRQIPEPRLLEAKHEAERIHALLATGGALPAKEITERAEGIRQVANDMEGALRRYKEAAIEAGRAYLHLKGNRGWDDGSAAMAAVGGDGSATAAPALPAHIEAWLPPAPHREKIVEWLRSGRATLLSEEEAARYPEGPQGREPLVQFEDGGVMPLRVVRWSEEVRNFYPLGAPPHPRGRLYRRRDAGPERPPAAST
jgi:hypothetical protein